MAFCITGSVILYGVTAKAFRDYFLRRLGAEGVKKVLLVGSALVLFGGAGIVALTIGNCIANAIGCLAH